MGKREEKKQKKQKKKEDELNKMINYLRDKYKNEIKYSCIHCLIEAYQSEINGVNGYITDEELIECSNNKLKHK